MDTFPARLYGLYQGHGGDRPILYVCLPAICMLAGATRRFGHEGMAFFDFCGHLSWNKRACLGSAMPIRVWRMILRTFHRSCAQIATSTNIIPLYKLTYKLLRDKEVSLSSNNFYLDLYKYFSFLLEVFRLILK